MKQVLQSYFKAFKSTTGDEQAITTFTNSALDTLFNKAHQYLSTQPAIESASDGLFTRSEFTTQELNEFKTEIYKRFGLTDRDSVEVTFAYPCDILLCTDKRTSTSLAELLLYKTAQLPGISGGRK